MRVYVICIQDLWDEEIIVLGRNEDEAKAEMVKVLNRFCAGWKTHGAGFKCAKRPCSTCISTMNDYAYHRRAHKGLIDDVLNYYGGYSRWVDVPGEVTR